ncbi:glutaredoxin domain-containing protein [Kocuria turfanensis]|uniref:NrdH-redoxin n=1 Tax=Kocuria turfanensis TaxID=388357 RepID=A0A512II22_9MICC|nr:glutaredoxin domain-containing protein [Kocuria turfanensis]GEO97317.1 NrdH-redoxin [Kocuria turfanensis]
MRTATLYTAPGCTDCAAAARSMDKKGLDFRAVDLAAEPGALDYVRALGHQRAPVTVVHNEHGTEVDHWSGYRPDKLMTLPHVLTG